MYQRVPVCSLAASAIRPQPAPESPAGGSVAAVCNRRCARRRLQTAATGSLPAMSLLIKNGEIVTADSRYVADIWCEGETITRIDRDIAAPAGAEVIDATGKYVFPGFIDPHVHIYLPFMGTFSKDTYESGSKAALVGGTTTLIEMCCPSRQDEALAGFELWLSQAVGKSACDFTFHMGVTKFDDRTEPQLREIVARGISSFKIFLAYKGAFGVDDG